MNIAKRRQFVPNITANEILCAVSEVYGVSYLKLRSYVSSKDLLIAQSMAIYLMSIKTKAKTRDISKHFSGANMQTVLNAKVRIKKLLIRDDYTFLKLEKIIGKIG